MIRASIVRYSPSYGLTSPRSTNRRPPSHALPVPLLLIDAFADAPFGGNSAAACLLDSAADDAWMQAVAAELRQPATAFVWPVAAGFGLRWFVAEAELTLCGHGTLAAAHALWETGRLSRDQPVSFET